VAADVAAAERAVRVRVEAGRRAVGDIDDGLLARAGAIRETAAVAPPISDDDVAELRHAAADVGRAARIRERTEAKVADTLQTRVAASAGIALHPAAILEASQAVLDAEAALTAAERAVLELGSAPTVDGVAPADLGAPADEADPGDPVLGRALDDFDEAGLVRRRGLRLGIALALLIAGIAIIATAVGAPPAIAGAGVLVAAVTAAVVIARTRGAATRIREREEVDLAGVARAVASTTSGRLAASMDAHERWVADRARLEAARDEAEELLRVARNRWHHLAGANADPRDASSLVRANDPQLAYDDKVAASSPTVRTVAAFHRRVQARWRVLWAGLGHDEPPDPERLEEILDDLLAEHRAARAELARLEEAEAALEAQGVVRRPLLLVEPRGWVAPGRLAQLLSSVPPEGEVVLLERDPDAKRV
jgi:hypothetical protein